MSLTFFHTAEMHRATFAALCAQHVPDLPLLQIVREDWLARARGGGIDTTLGAEISSAVSAAQGMVICTCTTLGPTAEKAGALRIDRPMMAQAARIGGPVVMLYCLESTARPSHALLAEEMCRAGNGAHIHPHFIDGAWRLFEAGDMDGFAAAIGRGAAQALAGAAKAGQSPAALVLAQASMASAAPLIEADGVAVLNAPQCLMRQIGTRHAASAPPT
ncbi:MAG: hypothetical protein ACRBBT_02100 [Paracoccaceae bacterium]